MSGIDVIGELLAGFPLLTNKVPVDRIKAGVLPSGTTLPALSVTKVSRNERATLKRSPVVHVTERVQVTVAAASYADKDEALPLTRKACLGRMGAFGGVTEVSVEDAGEGPDFSDEQAGLFMQSQDFRVSFNEPA